MNRAVLFSVGLLFVGLAMAQEAATRTGTWAGMQQKKAGELKPPVPDRLEGLVTRAEKIFIEFPSGFYPYFASVYHGGGLTLGAGYRLFYGDNTAWYIQGLYSFKNYKLIETGTESRGHLERRLSFGAKLGWRDATQVAYYGLGMLNS